LWGGCRRNAYANRERKKKTENLYLMVRSRTKSRSKNTAKFVAHRAR